MAFLISRGMYVSILGPAIPLVVGTFGGPYDVGVSLEPFTRFCN